MPFIDVHHSEEAIKASGLEKNISKTHANTRSTTAVILTYRAMRPRISIQWITTSMRSDEIVYKQLPYINRHSFELKHTSQEKTFNQDQENSNAEVICKVNTVSKMNKPIMIK